MGHAFRQFHRKIENKEPEVKKKPIGKDLRGANLRGADLEGVDLEVALTDNFTRGLPNG